MFEKYDQYLHLEFSIDYWSDEGISHAIALLQKFSEIDWSCLNAACKDRPTQWLVRCAESLGDNANTRCFDLLILLLQSSDNEVKMAALDSINALSSLGFDVSFHAQTLLNRHAENVLIFKST